MILVGIDYSMTSPALCIKDGGNFIYYNVNKLKKLEGWTYSQDNHSFKIGYIDKDFKNPIDRYSHLSKMFIDFIQDYTKGREYKAIMEGYSFGSKSGLAYNIAENAFCLKLRLHNDPNCEFLPDSIAPTMIKKFATGKGNAKKDQMFESYFEDTKIDLPTILEKNVDSSPVSDIVDAYWVVSYLANEVKI